MTLLRIKTIIAGLVCGSSVACTAILGVDPDRFRGDSAISDAGGGDSGLSTVVIDTNFSGGSEGWAVDRFVGTGPDDAASVAKVSEEGGFWHFSAKAYTNCLWKRTVTRKLTQNRIKVVLRARAKLTGNIGDSVVLRITSPSVKEGFGLSAHTGNRYYCKETASSPLPLGNLAPEFTDFEFDLTIGPSNNTLECKRADEASATVYGTHTFDSSVEVSVGVVSNYGSDGETTVDVASIKVLLSD